MGRSGKVPAFYGEDNDWYCKTGLQSDITISVESVNFHLHKFPLISKCGRIARICEESLRSTHKKLSIIELDDFPGSPDIFLIVAKFCYGVQVELTAKNVVMVYCAADYLEMTNEFGEGNLLTKSKNFFRRNILKNWKDCILALQSSESIRPRAEKLQIIIKCLDAISMMVCTDPNLLGWPMKMFGSLQSPGGSILWNGISTGARIRTSGSDWWFEDISYLSVGLFERLIKRMETRGIRPANLAGAVMYYARKYLPGLDRWQGGQSGKTRTVASFSLTPGAVEQKVLLERIEKLLPEKKGKSFCRFLLGLLRVALIVGANQDCVHNIKRRIGMQLELATLDSILIPSYSDSDTLYNTDCIEQIVHYFVSGSVITSFSPSSSERVASPSFSPSTKVAKLIDSYIAEIASDVNLKYGKIISLAEALPESSRSLHDGLYRAVDIYLKAHPWISEKQKEELCNIIDYQKLSIEACAHASQNERLPLRVVLKVLFFEQMHLRTALSGCLHALDTESVNTGHINAANGVAGQLVQRDGWVTVVRHNQILKVDMEKMRDRVGELEEEFGKMKREMKRVGRTQSSPRYPSFIDRIVGCKHVRQSSFHQAEDTDESTGDTPRVSLEQAFPVRHLRHRKKFSLF